VQFRTGVRLSFRVLPTPPYRRNVSLSQVAVYFVPTRRRACQFLCQQRSRTSQRFSLSVISFCKESTSPRFRPFLDRTPPLCFVRILFVLTTWMPYPRPRCFFSGVEFVSFKVFLGHACSGRLLANRVFIAVAACPPSGERFSLCRCTYSYFSPLHTHFCFVRPETHLFLIGVVAFTFLLTFCPFFFLAIA